MRYAIFIQCLIWGLQGILVGCAYGGGGTFTNRVGMQFVYISPGSFLMGSPTNEVGRDDDETLHHVTLSHGFYLATTEVTQGQYKSVMHTNPSHFKTGARYPVEQVSWNNCQSFITKLNQLDGTTKYRLPTEAEWEYACRAGSDRPFAYVDILKVQCNKVPRSDQIPWYWCNSNTGSRPVARRRSNPWGLYDMYGNVQEWCLDHCAWQTPWSRRTGAITDTYRDGITDPLSTKGKLRIVRGGAWSLDARYARAANRSFFHPQGLKRSYVGFRVLKEE